MKKDLNVIDTDKSLLNYAQITFNDLEVCILVAITNT